MKLKKVFPDDYTFFPRTWCLPADGSEFKSDSTNQFGKLVNRTKTYIVKPDNQA